MKRIKDGDVSYIKFEDGDDIDFIAKIISLLLYSDNEGNLYCEDYHAKRAVFFSHTTKKWKPIEFDSYDRDALKHIDSEEAEPIYKEYPPFDALDAIRHDKTSATFTYWAKKRQETPRKVVGWVYYLDARAFPVTDDEDDSHTAALINDIVEHQYYFGGDQMDMMPIFDDGTTIDFSSRGWGWVVAASLNEFDEMSYSTYAFTGWLPEEIDVRMPEIGPYVEEIREIEVDDKMYHYIYDEFNQFYDKHYGRYVFALLIISSFVEKNKIVFDAYTDKLKFINKKTKESFECNFLGYTKQLNTVEELYDTIDNYIIDIDDTDSDKFLYLGEIEEIKEKLKTSPVKVLVSATYI